MTKYTYNLNSTFYNSQTPPVPVDTSNLQPVRVVDVILDDNHPEWEKYGKSECIGAIKFRPLFTNVEESQSEELPVAYPLSSTVRTLPLKNEVVLLHQSISNTIDDSVNNKKLYYTTVIAIWNHPNHNAYPENTELEELDLGLNIMELVNVNPLTPFPGDVLLEGRQGQSLRFCGFLSDKNPWTTVQNNGQPLIILSNGQISAENAFDSIVEDVNQDKSSIYLTSNHIIPLEQAKTLNKSYNDPKPVLANKFQGSQIILNSSRVFINARDENVLISSKQSVGINAQSINLDSDNYFCIDSPQIFLGEKARSAPQNTKQPILLGNSVEQYLKSIIQVLDGLAGDLLQSKTVDGKPIPLLNKRGIQMQQTLRVLDSQLNPNGVSILKSKKVFVE